MEVRKLDSAEFAEKLRNGHGAAFLHILKYGDKGVEKELLHACLTSMIYDRQVESSRADWLGRMVAHSGRLDQYAAAIESAITVSEKCGPDFSQLIDLSVEMFERGFYNFKQVLIDLLPLPDSNEVALKLGTALLKVTGLKGLELAARNMVQQNVEHWEMQYLYREACELFDSKNKVEDFIVKLAQADESLAKFWELAQVSLPSISTDAPTPVVVCSLEELHDILQSEPLSRDSSKFRTFGRKSSQDTLHSLLAFLEKYEEEIQILRILSALSVKALPVVTPRLLELAYCDKLSLRRSARKCLAKGTFEQLRNIAQAAMQSKDEDEICFGLDLYRLNYNSDDFDEIETAILSLSNEDSIHSAGIAALDMFCKHDDIAMASILKWVYEKTPCSNCRQDCAGYLRELDSLPSSWLYEAQWDCSEDLRLWARSASI